MLGSAVRFLTTASSSFLRSPTTTATVSPRRHLSVLAAVALSSLVSSSSSSSSAWALSSSDSSAFCQGGNSMSTSTTSNNQLIVEQFPCRSDNYGYLLHDPATGATAAIDTPDGDAYEKILQAKGWTLTHIFNTHHHHDHVGGNAALVQTYGPNNVQVYGPATEDIPQRNTEGLKQGMTLEFGSITKNDNDQNSGVQILDVGGHTKGHIAFYIPSQNMCFVGDALFAMGCGRMFEGTPQQFWTSLQRLRGLPPATVLYCAHEYTVANAKFAVSVEPGNAKLQERFRHVQELRAQNKPTVPSTLQEELDTNPFLRCDASTEIQQNVGIADAKGVEPAQIFAKVRLAKDRF